MAVQRLVDLFKGVELFHGLNDDQLARLAAITRLEEFTDGDVVFRKGAQGHTLYVIAEGQVEVILGDVPDMTQTAVFLGRGQIVGEMALVDYGERSATIRCASAQAQLAVLQRDEFERLCAADTAIGYVVMRNMASDLSFKLRHRNLEA